MTSTPDGVDLRSERPFPNRNVEHVRDIAAALDVTVDDQARLREGLTVLVERHEQRMASDPGFGGVTVAT
jgi:hypothetical protein